MHCSRYRLTTLVAYVSTNDQWARPVRPLFSSSKNKTVSFQFSYVAVFAFPLRLRVCRLCVALRAMMKDSYRYDALRAFQRAS